MKGLFNQEMTFLGGLKGEPPLNEQGHTEGVGLRVVASTSLPQGTTSIAPQCEKMSVALFARLIPILFTQGAFYKPTV